MDREREREKGEREKESERETFSIAGLKACSFPIRSFDLSVELSNVT